MSSSLMSFTSAAVSGYLPKNCWRTYAPFFDLKSWYSPSTHYCMRLRSMPELSLASSWSHPEPHSTLMTFQLLHDLAVAAHRAVETLQIAVDDEDQVVELLAAAQRNGAERFRLVHLAVTHEGPHFARGGIRNATPMQVFQEPRLVDRHQRP